MRGSVLALLLVGACGARTSPRVDEDAGAPAPRRDAGEARDAGTDAATPSSGCILGPILGPYTEAAPAFAFSLERLGSSARYLVGYAHGWPPDERAYVAVLDVDRRTFERALTVAGGAVAAASDGVTGVALVEGEPDHLHLVRFDLATGAGSPPERVCDACFGPWVGGRPIFDGLRLAFAYRTTEDVFVYLDEGGGAAPRTLVREGESAPSLAALPGGGYALATHALGARASLLYILDAALDPGEPLELPIVPVGTSPGLLARDVDVIVVGRADESGAMHALRVEGDAVTSFPLAASESLYPGIAVAESRGVVAIALEGNRRNQVIPLRADTLEAIGETLTLVDSDAGSSYRRPTTIAPHAEGFVIVYGAWHEGTTYGLYARKLTCHGFD